MLVSDPGLIVGGPALEECVDGAKKANSFRSETDRQRRPSGAIDGINGLAQSKLAGNPEDLLGKRNDAQDTARIREFKETERRPHCLRILQARNRNRAKPVEDVRRKNDGLPGLQQAVGQGQCVGR
jgi:hypothetical protein